MSELALQAETTPGWFHHGDQILSLLEQHQPKVCVELGVWMGASAIPVARSIRRWGGTLTCIDTWSGDVHLAVSEQTPWMMAYCARNMIRAGVSPSIRLIPAPSLEAARWWDGLIDYLYIDADHSYEAVLADLYTWVPLVRKGGLIVGDDYSHRLFPGVQQAWDEYADAHELTLSRYSSTPPDEDGIQLVYTTRSTYGEGEDGRRDT